MVFADLNADTIRRYRNDFVSHRPHHAWNDLPNEEFLLKIGAAGRAEDRSVHPNVAGLVCFGDFAAIISQLPNFFLDYREKTATDARWTDRVCSGDATWSGNVLDFFYRLYDRIVADVKVPFALMADGIHRIDETEMHKSIREVFANALVHADYHGRQGIVVERRFREISIANPGTMRVPREEAIGGGRSDPRNASIFNIFSLINVGDRSGTGLCDHFSRWEKLGLPKPLLVESYDPERTILSFTFSLVNEGKVKDVASREKGREKRMATKGSADLPASVRQVYAILCEDSKMTYEGMINRLGFSTATIAKAIGRLVDQGYIGREGGCKAGCWKINK